MLYLKRLVSDICGTVQDDKNKIFKHVFIKPHDQAMLDNQQNENTINQDSCLNMQRIKIKCKMLSSSQKSPKLSSLKPEGNKKMLLLDLDKTIIFFTEKQGFKIRPHLKQFLKAVEPFYSIFIFTASTQLYLQQMLQNLSENDCGRQHFCGFLTRENCITLQIKGHKSFYVKDIKIFTNCETSNIVVVDDTPITYCLNPEMQCPLSHILEAIQIIIYYFWLRHFAKLKIMKMQEIIQKIDTHSTQLFDKLQVTIKVIIQKHFCLANQSFQQNDAKVIE